MSGLITMVKPPEPKAASTTLPAIKPTTFTVTCPSGVSFEIDTTHKTYRQLTLSSGAPFSAETVSMLLARGSGKYWTIHPDPPQDGEKFKIWGPQPDNASRPRLIELGEVQVS